MMIILKHIRDLESHLSSHRKRGKKIGFVPTMGALHEGHMSLIRKSREEADLTVCSIFVNPTQFNDPADYDKYPITLGQDIRMLEQEGCDVLFLPARAEIYPSGTNDLKSYDLGFLEKVYEGKFRPGHFQGVCQVVDILVSAVNPDLLYLGQKDYQQCMVIDRMLAITGRNEIELQLCPTLREPNGLAMSSRNRRLNEEERQRVAAIQRGLLRIKHQIEPGDTTSLVNEIANDLRQQGFRIDYFEVADAKTLAPIGEWNGKTDLVALAAVFLGEVRLIDNLVIPGSSS